MAARNAVSHLFHDFGWNMKSPILPLKIWSTRPIDLILGFSFNDVFDLAHGAVRQGSHE